MLIDTHCHLDFPEFDNDRDEVIARARRGGIGYMVNIGSSLEGSKKSLELSGKHDFIYAAVGIHPHEADRVDKEALDTLEELAKEPKAAAVGETGLDYYKGYSKRENQIPLFESSVALAKRLGLPLVIHSRSSEEDTLGVLKAQMPVKAVVHCFSGEENFLNSCIELGFLVSFTCNITYKKAGILRDLAGRAPLSRIMLETDAPYLSPEGLRGRRNEPLNVGYVAQEISKIKGIPVEEVADATTKNAMDFFGLSRDAKFCVST